MAILVPGRGCGNCTACCEYLPISTPELEKPTNLLCPHCVAGDGCSVYERRPSVCREWYCGWRILGWLDESWRPDRSGVMVRTEALQQNSITILLINGATPLARDVVVRTIASLIDRGTDVYLSMRGTVGQLPGKCHLNPELTDAVKRHDRAAVVSGLSQAVAALQQHKFEPDGLCLRTNRVR